MHVSALICAPTKNTTRHFTYVITLDLCHVQLMIHSDKLNTVFPRELHVQMKGSHTYTAHSCWLQEFSRDALIHNQFYFKKNFMI